MANDFVQVMTDGQEDAKTLSVVVNGDEQTQVETRLGESYPSVKKAIKSMTQAGVGFTPFESKNLMILSDLENGAYAIVTNDTTENSGLYLKKAIGWTKVSWDVDARQKEYADGTAATAVSIAANDATLKASEAKTQATAIAIDVASDDATYKANAALAAAAIDATLKASEAKTQATAIAIDVASDDATYKANAALAAAANDATLKASEAKTQAVAIATDLAAADATRKTNELSAITKTQFVDKNSVNSELYSDSNSLLMMKDKEGKPYLFVDKDAGLQLTGLDSTVQQNLFTLKSQTSSNSNVSVLDLIDADDNLVAQITSEDIKIVSAPNGIVNFIETVSQRLPTTENVDFKITGKDDQVVAVFNQEGDLKINAIPDGIANRLNTDFLSKQLKESSNDAKHDLHQSALSKITTLKMQTGLQAPIPIGCVPLDFTPPNALLNEMIAQPESRTVIDTPYGIDDGVVHPHIIQFPDTFNHKKYWLGLTPYYLNQDKFENPVIYGSDNLNDFVMFGDYPQPLSENPPAPTGYKGAYNSDIFHFYDFNTGDLCCGWRLTEDKLPTGREVSLLYRRTKDGINWSEAEVLMPKEVGDIALSPSVIYDFNAKKYYLYVVTGATGGGFKLSRYETNRIGGNWTNIAACIGLDSTGLTAWHADVRYLGDKIVALIQDNSVAQNLCLGMSSDGLTFITSNPLLTGDYLKPYKATLTCTTNDAGQIALNYIWTSNEKSSNADDRWRLYTQQTNFVNII